MTAAACERPACSGQLEDGYCNVCGMAPATPAPGRVSSSVSSSSGSSASSGSSGSSASSASSPTGSRRSKGTRSSAVRGNLGAGLVDVPPVPYRDPASVVLADPVVPERKRFCGSCDQPVGRARGDKPGRAEGFCPSCGHPFSFTAKLAAGDVVAGQYEVVGPIAHGGLGWIYLARDRNVSDRWVVLKGLLDSSDPSAMAAAIAERRFLAQVQHPAIVRIYNFVTHQSAGYIVMEYVGGSSLKDLRAGAPLPVAQAAAYLLEMLPALGYLHGQGMLFCDFKPDNVIQDEEQLKLIDLGGVRGVDDDQSDLYGTVGYQAPEVAEVGASVASDLYTVARTMAVLTFDFAGFQDARRYATSLPPASEVDVLRRYEALDRWMRRGTAADPDRRFGSAGEMADQLLGVLRQVLAIDRGRPEPGLSRVFTAELLSDPSQPGWRGLPTPVVDPGDDAAALLASLAAAPPDQLVAALSAAPSTSETRFQLVRAHLERGDLVAAADLLRAATADDPGDWRGDWWAGVLGLADDRPGEARARFDAVAAALPGELAPLLAAGVAAETDPDPSQRPAAIAAYQRVAATDPGFVGASFGLARVKAGLGDRGGAAEALALVPARSSFARYAQEERCRVLLAPAGGGPSLADLQAAARTLAVLDTDEHTRLELTRALLGANLAQLQTANAAAPVPDRLPAGVTPSERGMRDALERTLRSLARSAGGRAERVALVDEANTSRAWSLF